MEKNNGNDPQPQWEQLSYHQKVVEVWEDAKKYALMICDKVEDGEDILQDVAEIFLNIERINDVYSHKETQNNLKNSILALKNNEPPNQDGYNEFKKVFTSCLRSLAKKKIRETKNEKINLFEFRNVCKNAGITIENPTILGEIDAFFDTLKNENAGLEQNILYFIEKQKGVQITEIAKIHNTTIRLVKDSLKIITDILDEFKIKETLI